MYSNTRVSLTRTKLAFMAAGSFILSMTVFIVYLVFANSTSEGKDFIDEMKIAHGEFQPLTPSEHLRPPDQTFLTYPEWFLVHSSREYAEFLEKGRPSEFPFFRHIGQLWHSYSKVGPLASRHYSFNSEYHIMIMVIGVSTTLEYIIKGVYETLVGRFFEAISFDTVEDKIYAREADDYLKFINLEPWYKFDFFKYLAEIWGSTDLDIRSVLRSLERRYLLTSEFFVKGLYGKLIWKATTTAFEIPRPDTVVVLKDDDRLIHLTGELIKIEQSPAQGYRLASLPRYQAFTDASLLLAGKGFEFFEVAGNRGPILISVIAPSQWRPRSSGFDILFSQPIITVPSQKRVVLMTPISNLAQTLREFVTANLNVEHVYDF